MKNYQFLKSRIIKNINGLDMSILENKAKKKQNNTILMLHGFPEISFSFRHIMFFFAKKGFYCIAPDQRGFGKTKSLKEEKLNSFSILNLTKDISCLLKRLNINKFHIVGHDFGSYVSSYFCLMYPKGIISITLMSMPFSGPPLKKEINKLLCLNKNLARLNPKKKHYQYYFSSYKAYSNIMNCEQGLSDFFRGYFYCKSYDFKKNKPFVIKNFTAQEMSKMPEYYIMRYNLGMGKTIENFMLSYDKLNDCKWLSNTDLKFYVKSFSKSGIKKALKWYKVMLSSKEKFKLIKLNLPTSINTPAIFIAGTADWGIYQKPGELKKMEQKFFKNYFGTKIIERAGHWVQQEQPKKTFETIFNFYSKLQ